jgi:hypothetical protein
VQADFVPLGAISIASTNPDPQSDRNLRLITDFPIARLIASFPEKSKKVAKNTDD